MDQGTQAFRAGSRRSTRPAVVMLLAVSLFSMFAVAGCSHSAAAPAATTAPAPGAGTVGAGSGTGMDMVPADASTAWNMRPTFVDVSARTQQAYAFALYNPQFVHWMPCYCGCAGTGHTSNLDCYLKKSMPGRPTQFEQHASYCEVCVNITLTLKTLLGQGTSLLQIRQTIDATYGGAAPGTPTELPPA